MSGHAACLMETLIPSISQNEKSFFYCTENWNSFNHSNLYSFGVFVLWLRYLLFVTILSGNGGFFGFSVSSRSGLDRRSQARATSNSLQVSGSISYLFDYSDSHLKLLGSPPVDGDGCLAQTRSMWHVCTALHGAGRRPGRTAAHALPLQIQHDVEEQCQPSVDTLICHWERRSTFFHISRLFKNREQWELLSWAIWVLSGIYTHFFSWMPSLKLNF